MYVYTCVRACACVCARTWRQNRTAWCSGAVVQRGGDLRICLLRHGAGLVHKSVTCGDVCTRLVQRAEIFCALTVYVH